MTRIVSYVHRYKRPPRTYDAILSMIISMINRPTAASAPTRKMIICASRMVCLHRVAVAGQPDCSRDRRHEKEPPPGSKEGGG